MIHGLTTLALSITVGGLVVWMWHELLVWMFGTSRQIWPFKSRGAGNSFLFIVVLTLVFLALSALWALGGCEGNFKSYGCAHISNSMGSIPAIGLVLVPMVLSITAPIALLATAICEWRARRRQF